MCSSDLGGGQTASKKLAKAGLLACGINIPGPTVEGDNNAIRIGTPEIVRIGMKPEHMAELADLIYRGLTLTDPTPVQAEVIAFRKKFSGVHYTVDTAK